jgi:predicted exporter
MRLEEERELIEEERAMLRQRRTWHIEKGIPLALIATMVAQIAVAGWWAASIDTRLASLEKRDVASAAQGETIIRLDERLKVLQSDVVDIKRIIQSSSR